MVKVYCDVLGYFMVLCACFVLVCLDFFGMLAMIGIFLVGTQVIRYVRVNALMLLFVFV